MAEWNFDYLNQQPTAPTNPLPPQYTDAQVANQAWADLQAQKAEQREAQTSLAQGTGVPMSPSYNPAPNTPPVPAPVTVDVNKLAYDLSKPPDWRNVDGKWVNYGGINAGMLDQAEALWYSSGGTAGIDPAVRRQAEIIKDAWMAAARGFRSGASPTTWQSPTYAGNPTPGAINPATGLPMPAQSTMQSLPNPWQFNPLTGYTGTPIRQFNVEDVNWQGIPQPYRNPLAGWFGQQGFKPQGSLGQFQYRNFQSQTPYTFNESVFDTITDTNLKAWAKALFGLSTPPTATPAQ